MPTLFVTLDILFFITSILFLVKATELLINSLNSLSRSSNVEVFALAGFFSAVSTSIPELFVAASSAVAGKPNLGLGLAIGSNIADITLVTGLVALIGGGIAVAGDFVKADVSKAFGAIILPLIFLIDGRLTRFEGVILLLVFIIYHILVFNHKAKYHHQIAGSPFAKIGKWLHNLSHRYQKQQLGWLFFGIIMLLISSQILVESGKRIAIDFNMPILILGLIFVAIGTSIPELAFELRAIRQKQTSVVFGDLLGSLVANSTLVIGVTAIISPINIKLVQNSFTTAILFFLLAFFLYWIFIKTKLKLQPWEALILLSIYAIFIASQFGILSLGI